MGANYTEEQAWTMPKSRPPGRLRRTAARKTATRKTPARRTPVARKRRTLEISATVLPAAELEPKVTMDEVPQPEQAPPEEGDYQTRSKPEPSA